MGIAITLQQFLEAQSVPFEVLDINERGALSGLRMPATSQASVSQKVSWSNTRKDTSSPLFRPRGRCGCRRSDAGSIGRLP